jgi:hypothetical protein
LTRARNAGSVAGTVEAHRRFRADLRERKEHNRLERLAQLGVHEEKKRYIAEWIAANGTPEQRSRHAAGMLPIDEAIEAIAVLPSLRLKTSHGTLETA